MMRFRTLFSVAMLALAAGCGSTPTRFYTLAPISGAGPSQPVAGRELTLGIGPVKLPEALDRPQIVTRRGRNEFDLGEFDHWAEPLDENFTQVLAENLASLVPAKRVVEYPWERSVEIDYQVAVKVVRFDRDVAGQAVLKVRWSIKSPSNDNELLGREATYTQHPTGPDSAATVAAMNDTLSDLSRDLATAIRGLRGNAP